jgi:hypothetical protein
VYDENIGLNFLARNAPYHVLTGDLEGLDDVTFNPVVGLGRSIGFAVACDWSLHGDAGH